MRNPLSGGVQPPDGLPTDGIGPASAGQFPIVEIGASAGGLEALELFLKHLPPASDVAFAVVQHLDPTHQGMMPELLQRFTQMPVAQISDLLKVEQDHVFARVTGSVLCDAQDMLKDRLTRNSDSQVGRNET